MEITFHRRADRHRISRERVVYVIEHCRVPIDLPDRRNVVLFLGHDWNAIRLEVIAIESPNGDLFVFHAMPMGDQYIDDYMRVTT